MPKSPNIVAPRNEESNPEAEYFNSPLLYDEPPLQVIPGLARAIGLEEAIIVQQLHYLLRKPKNGRTVQGERWIYNTYQQWQAMFPWWSERTIRRLFDALEGAGIIISIQPEGRVSRRKYYRLNLAVVHKLKTGSVLKPTPDVAKMASSMWPDWPDGNRPNWPLPSTESTAKGTYRETKESKGTVSDDTAAGDEVFPPMWRQRAGTKEEKLARIRTPDSIPSQDEFYSYIEAEGLENLEAYRSDLYHDLVHLKFHQWSEETGRWKPVRNWKTYITALDIKIGEAND